MVMNEVVVYRSEWDGEDEGGAIQWLGVVAALPTSCAVAAVLCATDFPIGHADFILA